MFRARGFIFRKTVVRAGILKYVGMHVSNLYHTFYASLILNSSVIHFSLFQLNAHNTLNTYIYHQFPPTYLGVCYTIFRETIALLA
jgi:hypothetical protein